MSRRSTSHRGFTLVELLVVITIIGVIAGLAFGSWARARENARRAVCMTHLQQIGRACIAYAADWDGYFPTCFIPPTSPNPSPSNSLKSLSLLYDTYIPLRGIFVCPSTADACDGMLVGDTFSPHGVAGRSIVHRKQTSYAYDDTKGPLTDPEVPVAADSPPAPEEALTGGGGGGGGGDDSGAATEAATRLNSANHRRTLADVGGQNVLFYNGNVKWLVQPRVRLVDPQAGIIYDNIYDAADKNNPAASDSYIHQYPPK